MTETDKLRSVDNLTAISKSSRTITNMLQFKKGDKASYYGRAGEITAVKPGYVKIWYTDGEGDEEWIEDDDEDLEPTGKLHEDKNFNTPFGSVEIKDNELIIACDKSGWDSNNEMLRDISLAAKGQNDPFIDAMESDLEANGINADKLRGKKAKVSGKTLTYTLTEAKNVKPRTIKQITEEMWGLRSSGIPAKDTVGQDDGQPRRNFYVPSVMADRDVITNILDKFTKGGISHSFEGDDLIIKAVTYSTSVDQNKVMQDLQISTAEVVKFLKDEYKTTVGHALSLGKIEHESFDCVANYTTNHLSLCNLTTVYELPDSKAEDDKGLEKGELRGNIPFYKPNLKEQKSSGIPEGSQTW
jgi:hypothetical protein